MTDKKQPAKTAVVTGAGSGVGQAVVWLLARHHWRVVLVGRRVEALETTVRQAERPAANFLVCA
ncbi:MAG: SDR family NAD(P)-dependent oxidoreductase, partial [Verrucomicrobia bacterium]|nr:SDR family NAD(P)-dependent oxidoreductase [Verrucomicrobiota bacterium]